MDVAGAVLGAFGMLSFAAVFWLLVERSVAGASLAWLTVLVAAWFVRRKMRIVRRGHATRKENGPAVSQPYG